MCGFRFSYKEGEIYIMPVSMLGDIRSCLKNKGAVRGEGRGLDHGLTMTFYVGCWCLHCFRKYGNHSGMHHNHRVALSLDIMFTPTMCMTFCLFKQVFLNSSLLKFYTNGRLCNIATCTHGKWNQRRFFRNMSPFLFSFLKRINHRSRAKEVKTLSGHEVSFINKPSATRFVLMT